MSDTMTAAEWNAQQGKKKRHKYGVSPPNQRTFRGRVYHSKMERIMAESLALQVESGDILAVYEQVTVRLGEDFKTVVDFLVIPVGAERPYCLEVKGNETSDFKRVLKLWPKYQPLDLVVKTLGSGGWKTTHHIEIER